MSKRFNIPEGVTEESDNLHTRVIDELRKALSETLSAYMDEKLKEVSTHAGVAAIVAAVSKGLVYQGGNIVGEMYRLDGSDPEVEREMGLIIHNKFVEMCDELHSLAKRRRGEDD